MNGANHWITTSSRMRTSTRCFDWPGSLYMVPLLCIVLAIILTLPVMGSDFLAASLSFPFVIEDAMHARRLAANHWPEDSSWEMQHQDC